MIISGMHCDKCRARAEKALNEIDGVSAKVDLKKNRAVITLKKDVSDEDISSAISALGFSVDGITIKKGIFG